MTVQSSGLQCLLGLLLPDVGRVTGSGLLPPGATRSPEPALAGAGVARVPSPLYSQGRYDETRDQHLAVLHYDQHWIEREGTKSSLYYRDIMGFRAFKLSSTVLVSIHNAF